MTLVLRAAVTDQPIYLAEHEDLVSHQSAGAIVGFVGMIRNHDGGRQVLRLSIPRTHPLRRFLRTWWPRSLRSPVA